MFFSWSVRPTARGNTYKFLGKVYIKWKILQSSSTVFSHFITNCKVEIQFGIIRWNCLIILGVGALRLKTINKPALHFQLSTYDSIFFYSCKLDKRNCFVSWDYGGVEGGSYADVNISMLLKTKSRKEAPINISLPSIEMCLCHYKMWFSNASGCRIGCSECPHRNGTEVCKFLTILSLPECTRYFVVMVLG